MNTKECSSVGQCPFSPANDGSDFGCIPSPSDIVTMRMVHGKTWACHDNPKKPCLGALEHMKSKGIECSVRDGALIGLSDRWYDFTE